MTTLLKGFTACGCGEVGSTVAHRRAQQQRRAKAAVVSAGLVGNRYAVLAEDLEADGTPSCRLYPTPGGGWNAPAVWELLWPRMLLGAGVVQVLSRSLSARSVSCAYS